MTNMLLAEWDTPFALAPFDAISDADFAPAFEAALDQARAEVAAIADNPEQPSFANTVEALEASGKGLDQVLSVFYTLAGADSNPKRQELQREFAPKLAAYSSELYGNKALFARIEALWAARDTLGLTQEEARLLMLTHRGFRRSGAALTGAEEARMREIMARLAQLGTAFTQNLLADEAGWHMELAEADLAGLPDFLVDAARAAGREKGQERPVITLSRSLIVPFLQFSPRRDLRKKAYESWVSRGAMGGETDNREVAAEILRLRAERAALLGYQSFAAYKLETEMAKTPEAVRDLLMAVWEPAKAQAERDAARLTEMMQADGINGELEPWDWRYYAEKRRQAEHDLDETALKPYLSLEGMIAAAFGCANRLFGLEFRP
ncbi:MAG: peptidase M3, partial [Roseovarius sp.]|nr:peptidase M3 [Roseovarius sp.]